MATKQVYFKESEFLISTIDCNYHNNRESAW